MAKFHNPYRGFDIRHETVRRRVNRLGPMAAGRSGQGAWRPSGIRDCRSGGSRPVNGAYPAFLTALRDQS